MPLRLVLTATTVSLVFGAPVSTFAEGVAPAAGAAPPVLAASAAVLLDGAQGRVLYALAPELRHPPASTTKMLTALLVAESLTPATPVTISPRAAAERSGAAIGLEAGERWSADELMRAMLMHSANDAAVALAEAVAGSVEAFADRMNRRARQLGLRRSHFVTPHGRYHPEHYSTAYDLALLGRAALAVPWIAGIVRTRTWELRGHGERRQVINTNTLLWRYRDADGIKTGWIAESGPCLVASATRGGWRLIAVVLNSPQVFRDAAALLDYGFAAFTRVRAAAAGEVVGTVAVPNGARDLILAARDTVVVTIPRNAPLSRTLALSRTRAPIARGEVVGAFLLTTGGEEVGRVTLVAAAVVPPRGWPARLWWWLRQAAGRVP
ncbi:MAG: D-alanyl-D-alanine carboxypeptidase family protein [Armatimonadota bacterium]|nr:D-alanyl-D-alanine carboxypeptidase family protein [Armatimonadota bacterium]MDR7450353.1 D-alanyl-D-alanine carboxypeptidase family protein [Armatimonadota bacterium]MDR7467064.1 D-alanyl-D-alanine carboxypeptidase family protein [Armatimonadota bacterium]MDR7493394.1 D-alanyl-D-alanine carboxypeptidase family protein [Armatimonadota bacterium]MDR7499402.1 D-alanyl-D-alanine carboxypeptidase family protein [Armatimonadota bacterium]